MSKDNFTAEQRRFMRAAIRLSMENLDADDGGPFGAVIVRDGEIIAEGVNRVTALNDPTAHAEIAAIRVACNRLGNFKLTGCELYASCEPCPMCAGAIYWARLDRVYFAATRQDAANAGFDDDWILEELRQPPSARQLSMQRLLRDEALEALRRWDAKDDKTIY